MSTYHVYGKLYCRGHCDAIDGTLTTEQLTKLAEYVSSGNAAENENVSIEVEDMYEDDYQLIDMIVTALYDQAIQIDKVLAGESVPLATEEYVGGIAPTSDEAKLAFVAADGGSF